MFLGLMKCHRDGKVDKLTMLRKPIQELRHKTKVVVVAVVVVVVVVW